MTMAGAVPRRYGTLPRAHGCTVGIPGRHVGLEAWASHRYRPGDVMAALGLL